MSVVLLGVDTVRNWSSLPLFRGNMLSLLWGVEVCWVTDPVTVCRWTPSPVVVIIYYKQNTTQCHTDQQLRFSIDTHSQLHKSIAWYKVCRPTNLAPNCWFYVMSYRVWIKYRVSIVWQYQFNITYRPTHFRIDIPLEISECMFHILETPVSVFSPSLCAYIFGSFCQSLKGCQSCYSHSVRCHVNYAVDKASLNKQT